MEDSFPEAAGDFSGDFGFHQGFSRVGAELGKGVTELRFGGGSEPVYGDLDGVVVLLEVACFPGGEAEDGGAAEAAMGDEDGAGLGFSLRDGADGGVLDGKAGEVCGTGVCEVEGEE